MDKDKIQKLGLREIRFLIKKEIYNRLKEEAKRLDVSLASYIKANIKKWGKKI